MRLRSITQDKIPKPMVSVPYQGEEYPFLVFLLSHLYAQGIRKLILCVDHLSCQIEAYFGNGQQLGMEIQYDYAGSVMTAARVMHAMDKVQSAEVIVHCGDVFHPLDIGQFVETFKQHPEHAMQMAIHDNQGGEGAESNVLVDHHNQVIGFNMKKSGNNRLVLDAGILVFKREAMSYITDSPEASLTDDLYPALIQNHALGAYESGEVFFDIGTPSEYFRFCTYVNETGISPILKQPPHHSELK